MCKFLVTGISLVERLCMCAVHKACVDHHFSFKLEVEYIPNQLTECSHVLLFVLLFVIGM